MVCRYFSPCTHYSITLNDNLRRPNKGAGFKIRWHDCIPSPSAYTQPLYHSSPTLLLLLHSPWGSGLISRRCNYLRPIFFAAWLMRLVY